MEVELINVDVPGNSIVLSDLPVSIGRSQTADVCLNDPDLADFQCLIVQDGDALAVIDNVEDGGTFVNGVRAIWNSLMSGDKLRVGQSDFLVRFRSTVMSDHVR
jgi:predicted component of type VI protein secretion system